MYYAARVPTRAGHLTHWLSRIRKLTLRFAFRRLDQYGRLVFQFERIGVKADDLNLAELMEFRDGHVSFHGRRLILHDLQALGQFRRDLIEMMGIEQAQRIQTRKGFFWGQSDAAAMQRLFQWDSPEEWLRAGVTLGRIAGLWEASLVIKQLDLERGRVDLRMTWRNSAEVAQHLAELGQASAPVCWALAGYASGYASYVLGKSVYFMETQCEAAGAAACEVIGKDIESWGPEAEPRLSCFHAADIRRRVSELEAEIERQQRELARQRREIEHQPLVGAVAIEARSIEFKRTLELAARVAKFDTTVLITGETGSGKEVLARYLHESSPRSTQPWLAINCSALPENLLESELFGHRAGAFTGAARAHSGLFEEANGGTLFLDEIGDVSPAMQVKLLRVLQEREVRRVGESKSRRVNVRVISATNQDLPALINQGRFREDLYYRLNVVHIRVPPLRERRDDILPLARRILATCAERLGLARLRLAPACVDALLHHPWPGNVRELENALEHAAVMSGDGTITPELLPLVARPVSTGSGVISPERTLAEVERAHIQAILECTGGNRAQAARILGIGEATLYRHLREHAPERLSTNAGDTQDRRRKS